MPGPGTTFTGPLLSGTQINPVGAALSNVGLAVLSQSVALAHNGTNTVDGTIALPYGSQIVDILADTTTAWNSATSDTLSVGTSSGDTSYASGVDVHTAAGRIRPTFTAAQLANMLNVGGSGNSATVVATVTPVGSASAGSTTVTILYVQTVQLTAGS